jgi:hypothetical protein
MKKVLSILLFAAILADNTNAQNANFKRTVLFTLDEHEEFYQNEYFAEAALDGYRFAAVLYNTQTDKYTFVFNGKRVLTSSAINDKNDNFPMNISYINPSEENGYIFAYHLAGRAFANVKGKAFPIEGQGEFRVPPFARWGDRDDRHYFHPTNNYYGFIYYCGNSYVCINGKIWGPYQDIKISSVADNGMFAFTYNSNSTYGYNYANINGKIWGPYINISNKDFYINNNGKYAFVYEDNDGKRYANINGKEREPEESFKDISDIKIYEAEDGYTHEVKNGIDRIIPQFKWIRNSYDDTDPEIEGNTSTEAVSPDGKHSFYSDLNYEYVVIDGKEEGHSPALRVWYNAERYSFVWNSIEGRELVVYEFKLD